MCILFPWSPISPTWMGCSQKWELQCIYVYYSLITYFPKHGGGCSQKWELQCICVYYSLDHLFPQHGWVAHRNENCDVCICILFPWSPIFPTWRGCSQQWEFQCIYVYYSLDHLFARHGEGCWGKWELQCLYVYIMITYFPTWMGCSQQCSNVCVYYSLGHLFSRHGSHRNENWNVCICILFPWSPISTNMEGVAHRNENCNVCMCILFPSSTISPTWMGSSQKWELQCL